MSELSAPKNLTRNVLIGMAAGVAVASAFYYGQSVISDSVYMGIQNYVFDLGGQVFKNLLMLVVVPLVFFSLVTGISSLSNMVKLGSIALKTVGLYLFTTAIAVSLALFFGWIFGLSGEGLQVGEYAAKDPTYCIPGMESNSIYCTVLNIFPNNIFGAFIQNNMLGIVFISILLSLIHI